MPIYWDQKEGCFVVPENECPYPIAGRDNTPPCENCGCTHSVAAKLNDKVDRLSKILNLE